MTIKEFSNFAGVKAYLLRNYDEMGILTPAVRGPNNYRYYTPVQIITFNFIKVMEGLGVPLEDIKEMSTNRSPEKILDMLNQQEFRLDMQLYKLKTAYSIIHTFYSNIQNGLAAEAGDIRVENKNEEHYILGDVNHYKTGDNFYEQFFNFCVEAGKRRINLNFPIGGYYQDMNALIRAPGLPERFFSQDPLGDIVRPKGRYLVGYSRGYYGCFGDIPIKMRSYSVDHSLTLQGPVLALHLHDEISIADTDQYLACIMVGIEDG